jgi:hypothetical protein
MPLSGKWFLLVFLSESLREGRDGDILQDALLSSACGLI